MKGTTSTSRQVCAITDPEVLAKEVIFQALDRFDSPIIDECKENRYVRSALDRRIGCVYKTDTLQGYIATVFDQKDSQYRCIKCCIKELYRNRETLFGTKTNEDFLKEIDLIKRLNGDSDGCHPCIITVIDFYSSQFDYYCVMDLAHSSLLDWINSELYSLPELQLPVSNTPLRFCDEQRNPHLKFDIIHSLFTQIGSAIQWLHSRNVCHLDLSLENILCCIDESDSSAAGDKLYPIVKITDFGVSKNFTNAKTNNNGKYRYNKCVGKPKRYQSIESIQCLSPNIAAQHSYDPFAADVWAFGVMLYYCLFGDWPFEFYFGGIEYKEINGRYRKIMDNRDAFIENLEENRCLYMITQLYFDILAGIFQNENDRLTMPVILEMLQRRNETNKSDNNCEKKSDS